MNLENRETPQKSKLPELENSWYHNYSHSKIINPCTPKSTPSICSSSINWNPTSVVQTPPAKRYHKIKNPFEVTLAETLHHPLIGSPSLFQQPVSPQMSSTQFEWTIDEVSSLKPANVEPHETQFQDSPNPEFEAKAQMAISSYFKDNQIVPSPVDCPLRSNRIILSEMNGNTPISKPGRRIKESASQTELTLPPILPFDLEEALKPYFLSNTELPKNASNRSFFSRSSDGKDTSLRRKLFDLHNIIVIENENDHTTKITFDAASNHANSSPISFKSVKHNPIAGKLSDSLDKSSFGSLSPISATEGLSPSGNTASATKRLTQVGSFRAELEELFSPIHPPSTRKSSLKTNLNKYRNQCSDITTAHLNITQKAEENENFNPERSSSPLLSLHSGNTLELSSDSFNVKISRLQVNMSTSLSKKEKSRHTLRNLKKEEDFMCIDDVVDETNNTADMDDDMHISQVSTHSSNCSSSQSCDTPRGKKRSASRKNLSQSFSANCSNEVDYEKNEDFININQNISNLMPIPMALSTTTNKKSLNFYRTDSGFNETSQQFFSCDAVVNRNSLENCKDMVSSTPSKCNKKYFSVL